MTRALLLSFAFAAVLPAQSVTVTSPPLAGATNVDRPFPGGIGRYQQWYSAGSLQGVILQPMRFEQLEFFAGNAPTSQAAQINCEILMGHGKFSGVTGNFDTNFDDTPVIVKPTGNVQLSAGSIGAVVLTIPFTTLFTWDRTRPVLLEVRIYGNSLGSQPFPYNFRGHTALNGVTSRVYSSIGPGVPTGTVTQGMGMVTRITARPGAVLGIGPGCPGEGGFVPVASVLQVPRPGIVWTHQLTNAASQRFTLWVIGDTNQAPFPVDLMPLFGLPASTCFLRTNPANTFGLTTAGGGAGGGAVSLPITLPAVTSIVGASVFTQWVVFDPLGPTGFLSVSNAHWSIVGP
jgi:hypothetical protein